MRKRKKRKTLLRARTLNLATGKEAPFYYREAYKSLRTNVKFIAATEQAKSFIVTSALQMESKSNVVINLALTLAEENKKVIVVDCDFRKPTIHKFLKLETYAQGITNVLMGECTIKEAVCHVNALRIDVLPVGTVPPNPTELLSAEGMKVILDTLRRTYDYVLIDTPPVSVVTDAAIVGGLVDGAFLVIRSDFAPVQIVELAKKKLEDVHVKIYGIILSRFDVKRIRKSTGYYYSYNDYYYGNKE